MKISIEVCNRCRGSAQVKSFPDKWGCIKIERPYKLPGNMFGYDYVMEPITVKIGDDIPEECPHKFEHLVAAGWRGDA